MKKLKVILPVALFVLLTAVRMHAQIGGTDDGCGESPENPTLILGMIVSVGSVGFVQARRYLQTRNDRKNK